MPELTQEKMEIVGIPRFDSYFDGKNLTEKNQIVFFAYWKDKFYSLINNPENQKQAEMRTEDFIKAVMDFAVAHPDINVIIKTKAAQHYLNYIQEIVDRNFNQPIPNLTITSSGDSVKLIQESMAILSFHSLTLIEALIADKTIISPYFDDLVTDSFGLYFTGFSQLLNYAKTKSDLEKIIIDKQSVKINPELKQNFLQKFIYLPDGKACQRTEQAIINTIKSLKN